VGTGDLVVDIGARTGMITRALAATGADVIALELDRTLAAGLKRRAGRNVTVVETDALDWSWPTRDFVVVANLPFASSGAILGHLLRDPSSRLQRAEVIVQWGFAAKHGAVWPATLRSTYWRAWYDLVVARRLARTAFTPTPGVDAAVLMITRRTEPLVPAGHSGHYLLFLSDAFRATTRIRSSLRPHLSPLQLKRLAPTLGFAPEAHPRDLDARQWASLFTYVMRP